MKAPAAILAVLLAHGGRESQQRPEKPNRDFQLYATVLFMKEYLLK